MADIAATEAASTLADYFGSQLAASHDEGRQLMADALNKQFDISIRKARELVDVLEHAGTIRWIARHPGAAPGDQTSGRLPGVGVLGGEGYWQLEPA